MRKMRTYTVYIFFFLLFVILLHIVRGNNFRPFTVYLISGMGDRA